VPSPAPVSQLNLQLARAEQVSTQSPRHFTSQLELSAQDTVLPGPTLNLHSATFEQLAVEPAPAFSSHLASARQLSTLPSPPRPLHSEVSSQNSLVTPSEAALHLASVSQRSVQPAALHVVLQSVPAVHVQLLSSVHAQPVPVHDAGPRPDSSGEQAAPSSAMNRITPGDICTVRMVVQLRADRTLGYGRPVFLGPTPRR
jgi:hypothetical protein